MEIEVTGTSVLARGPERATVKLRVGFEGADKAKVLRETTELVRRVQGAIDELAARDPSPTTWSSVQPIATRSWRPHHQDGKVLPQRHSATSLVLITFRDVAALSAFVDRVGAESGMTIDGVDWRLTDATRQATEDDALTRAVAAARTKAETIARAAGAAGVEFSRITDAAQAVPAAYGATRMAAFEAGSPGEGITVTPEDIEVRADVLAVFTTT